MDDNDGSHATSKLSRVRRNASNMWDHFERLTNTATGTCEHTKCNYCGKVLSYKVTSGIMEEFGCDGGNNDDIYIQDELMRFIRDEQDVEPKSELEKYFEEACEDGGKDIDILGWWESNRFKYKIISQIARDVLAIPVSTVASESAFSTSGRVLDPFRSCLTPKVVQSLICTQDWLRSAPTPINIEELMEDAEKYDAEANGLTIVDDNDIVDSDINADTDDENL